MSESSPFAAVIWRPSATGSCPSATTTFLRAFSSDPSGRWSPTRSMAATSAFASSGSRRAGVARVLAQAEHPRDQRARVGVLGLEDHAAVRLGDGPGVPEVALHEPLDLVRDPHLRAAARLAELPLGPGRVLAVVEVLRRVEV